MRLLTFFLLFSPAFGWEHASWLEQVETRLDDEAISWLRKKINPEEQKNIDLLPMDQEQCKNCLKTEIFEIDEPKFYIFMSFSIPDAIWLSLSQEMNTMQAIFVLRGLPDNSFNTFAQKIQRLKQLGMDASVQIHPTLFKKHSIDKVPTIVSSDASKVSGAVSLHYALDLFDKEDKNSRKSLRIKSEN